MRAELRAAVDAVVAPWAAVPREDLANARKRQGRPVEPDDVTKAA
ncbi:hypothetical protein [Streptomyces xanthophaeus]